MDQGMTGDEVREEGPKSEIGFEKPVRQLALLRNLVIAQSASLPFLFVAGLIEMRGKYGLGPLLIGVGCLFVLILSLVGLLVARRGHLVTGNILFIASSLVAIVFFVAFYGTQSAVSFIYIWPVMVAGILLEPVASVVVAVIGAVLTIGLFIMERLQMGVPLTEPGPMQPYANVVNTVVVYLFVSYLAWLSARNLIQALAESRERAGQLAAAKAEIERKNVELEAQRAGLEEDVARQTRDLTAALEEQRRLVEAIGEMSTPVVPVFEGVIVLPLVGVINEQRAQRIVGELLAGLKKYQARVVILDITGVPVVNSVVANHLLEAAEAVRLLGGEVVLVGITPRVAQTIVTLGVDLGDVVTRGDLRGGVVYALSRVGMDLTAKESRRPRPIY
ncbi:MAG: STAS domain-containing protein [Chloroflexota bacterium]|nr:STAS domain-containing protein [Chloroflexota bacterium]